MVTPKPRVTEERLATTAATGRARCDRGGFEFLEVLEHADHRVASRGVRLVRDRAAEADAKLRAELRFDQSIGAKSLLRIIVTEIRFTTGGSDPDGCERGSTGPGCEIANSLTELRSRWRTSGTGGRATRPSLSSSGRRRTGRVIDLSVSMDFFVLIPQRNPWFPRQRAAVRWTATLPDHVHKCDEIPRESRQKIARWRSPPNPPQRESEPVASKRTLRLTVI